MRVAAVDIGTNTTRLLVAEGGPGGARPTTLDRRVVMTRLGQGVDATGRLAPEAVERTVAAVRGFAEVWRDLGAERIRITATSAARDAANAAAFSQAVEAVAGTAPEVLTGEEEAAAAFRGAVGGLPHLPRPVCVLDIGGGSTELIVGAGSTPDAATSRQLGSVRLTERVFDGDPPTAAAVEAARAHIAAELDAAADLVDPGAARALIAVAGTATTVAALHLRLPRYQPGRIHGTAIPLQALVGVAARLRALPSPAIAALGPVEPGREDVLTAGAMILEAVVARFGFGEVVVSEADILDGLVAGLLDSGAAPAGQPAADGGGGAAPAGRARARRRPGREGAGSGGTGRRVRVRGAAGAGDGGAQPRARIRQRGGGAAAQPPSRRQRIRGAGSPSHAAQDVPPGTPAAPPAPTEASSPPPAAAPPAPTAPPAPQAPPPEPGGEAVPPAPPRRRRAAAPDADGSGTSGTSGTRGTPGRSGRPERHPPRPGSGSGERRARRSQLRRRGGEQGTGGTGPGA